MMHIYELVHDIAPDYRPHHRTVAFWRGVHDTRWRLEVPSSVVNGEEAAYAAGCAACTRAIAMIEKQNGKDET